MEETLRKGDAMLKRVTNPTEETLALKEDLKKIAKAYQAGQWDEEPKAPEPEERGNALNPIAEGATYGAASELAAAGAATVGTLLPESMGGIPSGKGLGNGAYTEIRDSIDADLEGYREREPVASFLLEQGGSAVTGGAAMNRVQQALDPGAAPAKRLATNMIGGGTGGAIYGGMSAEEGDRMESAGEGFMLGAPVAGAMGEWSARGRRATNQREQITEALKSRSGDRVAARWELGPKGTPVKDTRAREAIRQGVPEDTVVVIKSSSDADKRKMAQMLDIQQRRMDNPRESVLRRPSDVAGDAVAKRYDTVLELNQEAGSKLDEAAEALKGVSVDYAPAFQNFRSELARMGVTFDDGINFGGSDLDGIPELQSLITRTLKRLHNEGMPLDGKGLHRVKRFLDQNISYGRTTRGLSGKAESVIQKLRRDINEGLKASDDNYSKVNEQYSDTIGVLDELQSLTDKRVNLSGPNAGKALGTLLRRLTGNQASRIPLLQTIDGLESVSRKYGIQYEDDVISQVLFVNELEELFGPSAQTSFLADVSKGAERGWKERTWDAASSRVGPLFGRTDDNRMKALRELLKVKPGTSLMEVSQ